MLFIVMLGLATIDTVYELQGYYFILQSVSLLTQTFMHDGRQCKVSQFAMSQGPDAYFIVLQLMLGFYSLCLKKMVEVFSLCFRHT